MFHCPHPPLVQSRGAGPFCSDVRGSMVAVGLDMASRGATLVLHTSWLNCSSWIHAKEHRHKSVRLSRLYFSSDLQL
ncbi:hypothetical protein GW17_00042306 [Ensete ventricosum]|nr:hypothetical protein GW17_00042306 [Ensete ventricosum]